MYIIFILYIYIYLYWERQVVTISIVLFEWRRFCGLLWISTCIHACIYAACIHSYRYIERWLYYMCKIIYIYIYLCYLHIYISHIYIYIYIYKYMPFGETWRTRLDPEVKNGMGDMVPKPYHLHGPEGSEGCQIQWWGSDEAQLQISYELISYHYQWNYYIYIYISCYINSYHIISLPRCSLCMELLPLQNGPNVGKYSVQGASGLLPWFCDVCTVYVCLCYLILVGASVLRIPLDSAKLRNIRHPRCLWRMEAHGLCHTKL